MSEAVKNVAVGEVKKAVVADKIWKPIRDLSVDEINSLPTYPMNMVCKEAKDHSYVQYSASVELLTGVNPFNIDIRLKASAFREILSLRNKVLFNNQARIGVKVRLTKAVGFDKFGKENKWYLWEIIPTTEDKSLILSGYFSGADKNYIKACLEDKLPFVDRGRVDKVDDLVFDDGFQDKEDN